jgi:NAD(P)H-hydrate epimerase
MGPTLSRDAVRELDRRAVEAFGIPSLVLMENAGRGAAEVLLELGVAGAVHVVCGKGNNGGDGFVVARHLDVHGRDVRVHLCCPPDELRGDALVNFEVLRRAGLPIGMVRSDGEMASLGPQLQSADWVVDALFGTGLRGPVKPPYDQIIGAMNDAGRPVLAVDIPSGLDCDTGRPLGSAVRARHTVTFVAVKRGFIQPGAREHTGQVHVAHIGVPRALLRQFLNL